MPRQTGTEDVARRPAVPDAASEKGEPNVQKILCHEGVQDSIDVPDMKVVPDVQDVPDVPNMQDSIDVPGTTAYNIFNTNSPEEGQTKKIAMPATTSGERGAGGITKCAPTCVTGNFATFAKATASSSQRQRCPFI